jgi:hypothetical protein
MMFAIWRWADLRDRLDPRERHHGDRPSDPHGPGQRQPDARQFKTSLCSRMSIFAADCASRAKVDVRVDDPVRNVNPPDPLAGDDLR